jgi:hypothetical protein
LTSAVKGAAHYSDVDFSNRGRYVPPFVTYSKQSMEDGLLYGTSHDTVISFIHKNLFLKCRLKKFCRLHMTCDL